MIMAAIEAYFVIIQSEQTKWISSAFDRYKSNVIIDQLMVTSEDELQELLIHLNKVRQAASNAHASQFRKRNYKLDSLDSQPIWKKAYKPLTLVKINTIGPRYVG
ncbi:hypothetical protein GLOIN_2v1869978 [Rhizophagus clarus]|uniref:Uncharacterized protein n=1 Tax=Rhizophagus clarus TaxID=94130 RepID=A0A8H3LEA0_9GLOM|nr:hypothetical protein GLOIN_2v1869978 [Rhizophagus clarus]